MKKDAGNFYSKNKKHILFFLPFLLIVFFDQLIKYLARLNFSIGESITLIPKFLSLTYVQNTGAGFGILRGFNFGLMIVSILVVGLIFYHYKQIKLKEKLLLFSTSFVLGGAIGNLIDRLFYGFVTDFISFSFWPAFNVADSFITLGGIGLAIYFWKK